MSDASFKSMITMRLQELKMPPIRDVVVLGRNAPIGCVAMRRALELISPVPFAHLEVEDDVISDVLVRRMLLNRIKESDLLDFVLTHVKPHLHAEEALDLELYVELQASVELP